jgi:hypothetical protein
MLTREAAEDRAWGGHTALRQLIGSEKLREYTESLYGVTSVADPEFEHYRRYAILGGLVAQNTEQITQALAAALETEPSPEAREARLWRVMGELKALASTLDYLASDLSSAAQEVRRSQHEVYSALQRVPTVDGAPPPNA